MMGRTDFVCLALLFLVSASQCSKVYSLEYKLLILVCTGMCMDNRVSDVLMIWRHLPDLIGWIYRFELCYKFNINILMI
jgi:hypothetical protein